jgi:CRP/FNR family transcriptional regulator, cyclic AMP receptor protein
VPSVYEAIASAPIFEGLDSTQLEFIADGAEEQTVTAGTLVLTRGETAERFFVIREGCVALEIESPGTGAVRLLTLHETDVAGWSWMFAPYRWEVDGRAVTDCRLIAIDGVRLRHQCAIDSRLGYAVAVRFAADALRRAKDGWYQILDLTVRDA